jgi:NAD(P)-dependent dehydrogenase (short-subunit alcohol dehydrogenase family)
MKLNDYDNVMNVNVKSVINLTKLCLPYFINQREGSIVNVSSVTGSRSEPGLLAYSISKAALDQFTKCIALGIHQLLTTLLLKDLIYKNFKIKKN